MFEHFYINKLNVPDVEQITATTEAPHVHEYEELIIGFEDDVDGKAAYGFYVSLLNLFLKMHTDFIAAIMTMLIYQSKKVTDSTGWRCCLK